MKTKLLLISLTLQLADYVNADCNCVAPQPCVVTADPLKSKKGICIASIAVTVYADGGPTKSGGYYPPETSACGVTLEGIPCGGGELLSPGCN